MPCQFNWLRNVVLRSGFSTGGRLKQGFMGFDPALPKLVTLAADLDGMLAQLGAKGRFDEEDGLEGRDVHLVEDALKAPAHALATLTEGGVHGSAVRATQHHPAGPGGAQINLEIPRLHEALQLAQERPVFLGEFHGA